jgi:paraquat-inducible protein A
MDVPVLLFATGVLIISGIAMPALETRTLFFWRDEYSVLMNVVELGRDGQRTAAAILAVCSIAYPLAKLAALVWFWLMPFPDRWRSRLIRLLRLLGRWSMIDVFAITAIILGSLAIGPIDSEPQLGLYVYAAGVLCLMVATLLMDRMAVRLVPKRALTRARSRPQART